MRLHPTAVPEAAGLTRGTVLVTDVRFWRLKLGSQARISALLDWVRQRTTSCTVLFVGELSEEDEKQVSERCAGLDFLTINSLPFANSWRIWDRAAVASSMRHKVHVGVHRLLGRSAPYTFDSYFRPDYRARFGAFLAQRKPATVIIEYARLAYLMDGVDVSDMQTIIDTHDVLHQRWAAFAGPDRTGLIRTTAGQEASVLRRFDHVLAIQHRDARHFREDMGLRSVTVVMHAQEVQALHWRRTGDILMVGSNMPPNVDGARMFLQHWPRVLEELAGRATLSVVGAVCEALESYRAWPGVRLLGPVDTLKPHYEHAQLVINPVGYGSGLKIKSVEAICHGRPLLTTEAGAEGLDDSDGHTAFVVAKSGAAFADACIRLMQDDGALRSLAAGSVRYAQIHFSPSSAYAGLARLLDGA